MPEEPLDRDEPIKVDLDPETTLRELMKVDPDAPPAAAASEQCEVEGWADNGVRRCALPAGHMGPHQLR